MLTKRFEGSFRGDAARLAPDAVLECKICGHVYDPAAGCEDWQVPAGTPFAELPQDWRCPKCDGARDQFMVIDGGGGPLPTARAARPARSASEERLDTLAAAMPGRFEAAFREIHVGQMRGVPLLNEALEVKAVGFRVHEGRVLGMLITPWFMNIVLAPGPEEDWSAVTSGTKALIGFPSGEYEFVAANRPETGPYKACSLFSPVFEFTSMLQATETACAALIALFDPAIREDAAPPATPDRGGEEVPTRRALIFGGGTAAREPAGS